ncbi:MAG: hypothetical protein KatS3mg081_2932 [Gemmatimonadales bacterium]|nr:MAG: hypothetical protein KatS3mg081_2932 [Gemmatimonadales bacterium]
MIIEMARVRILGPRDRLCATLEVIEDLGVVHPVAPAPVTWLKQLGTERALQKWVRHLEKAIGNLELALAILKPAESTASSVTLPLKKDDILTLARLGCRVYRAARRLKEEQRRLEEERAAIIKYREFFDVFREVIESESNWPNAIAYHILVRGDRGGDAEKLRAALDNLLGAEFALQMRRLTGGDIGAVIVTPSKEANRVEGLLEELGIQDVKIPETYGGGSLADAMPRMLERLEELERLLEQRRESLAKLRRDYGPELERARAALWDRLELAKAAATAGVTDHAFVFEGWVPAALLPRVRRRLREVVGEEIAVSAVSREEWASEGVPVVLRNPRLFRPFETIVALLPLPRYGSVDPTPFVAVFFPAFFGLIVGDIGYGALLAAGGLMLRRKSKPGTTLRNVAEIIGPCALFSILAGFLYGEFFGDLGQRWFGLEPLLFSREEAVVTFLLLALALGAVHVLLGFLLGIVGSIRGRPRQAVGRGAAMIIVALAIASLLAAVGVLPEEFFTPSVIGVLLTFPVLVLAEGLLAPIELLSAVGNILSYARIMALGVASLMLAVVANRMVGAMGSVAVGILFGLLFHLVNFAIVVLSPTVHVVRLHYVEFFGKFYSPGGMRYEPLGRASAKGSGRRFWDRKEEKSWR